MAVNVTRIQRIVETGHGVSSSVRNLLHLGQLLRATSSEVQERQLIEILRLLIRLLDNLVTNVLVECNENTLDGSPCGYPV